MANKKKQYSEFETISSKKWKAKIEQDLKGKSLESLNWNLGKDWEISPFHHKDDVEMEYDPIGTGADNDWAIAESFQVSSPKRANQNLLTALENGVNAPIFYIRKNPDVAQLLEGVHLKMISCHFLPKTKNVEPVVLLKDLAKLAKRQKIAAKDINGSIFYEPLSKKADIKDLVAMLKFAQKSLPNFKVLTLDSARYFKGPSGTPNELSSLLLLANSYIEQLLRKKISLDAIHNHVQFNVSVGLSYFMNIAKIRALNILWANLMKAHGWKKNTNAHLHATFAKASQAEDQYQNMIRATTQAMSAVIGGIDVLNIPPSSGDLKNDFSKRIARNVQHILKMESQMELVVDPASGSYFIESLTDQVAEKAWADFQQKV